jgi:hypothetical protein
LHCRESKLSSSGLPVENVSRAVSSNWLTTGPGEAGTEFVEGVSVPFFLSSAHCQRWSRESQIGLTIDHAPVAPVTRFVVLWRRFLELDSPVRLLSCFLLGRNFDGIILIITRK